MFRPGEVWKDTDGLPIQAHGGGALYHDGIYYWFGENKGTETTVYGHIDVIGVSCYSSPDLYHWTNEGVVLAAVPEDPDHDLHPSKVVERPKVIYNENTKQFVMWLHVDSADYSTAKAGVAVANSPTGPYRYLGSVRPGGYESRDLTLFQDEDGSAYLVFASDWNKVTRIILLTDDYLSTTEIQAEAFRGVGNNNGRESPALFRHGSRYFCITSGCTYWDPNEAEYAVAKSPLGPWRIMGNPCAGEDAQITFGAQNTFVLKVRDYVDAYILMLDRWIPTDLGDSRYVWLPIELDGDSLIVRWREAWDLTLFE